MNDPDTRPAPTSASSSRADDDANVQPQPADAPPPCLAQFTVTSHASVLAEQRRIGPHRDDFQRSFESAVVDTKTFTPVAATSELRAGERPVLWWTAERDRAVVRDELAGPLEGTDAFMLRPGQRVEIGKLTPKAEELSPRSWLELLLRGGIVNPYAHLEAELCLRSEAGGWGEGYRAEIDGVHVYFTNEENRDRYRFVFEIDRDRRIFVTGTAPD